MLLENLKSFSFKFFKKIMIMQFWKFTKKNPKNSKDTQQIESNSKELRNLCFKSIQFQKRIEYSNSN